MHSSKKKVIGIKTTLEIILFEVLSKSHNSTGGVKDIGRKCP